MRGDVDVDLGMLRTLLGEQAQVLQSANHQAFEESFTRVQQIWDESLAQVEAKVAEQKVVLQQLSNRCCMLEERLHRLEEVDSGAVDGSTVVLDEDVSTTAVNGDQKVGKKKGRRRNKVAPCKLWA